MGPRTGLNSLDVRQVCCCCDRNTALPLHSVARLHVRSEEVTSVVQIMT
jgi:hypothetical protein